MLLVNRAAGMTMISLSACGFPSPLFRGDRVRRKPDNGLGNPCAVGWISLGAVRNVTFLDMPGGSTHGLRGIIEEHLFLLRCHLAPAQQATNEMRPNDLVVRRES
jgi:hypothetical protein